jgi:thiamine biosynthesis lipoprotein ApbE
MSDYRDDSELMALSPARVRARSSQRRPLSRPRRVAAARAESGGAFDVTAAPLIHLWRPARGSASFPDPPTSRRRR